MGGCARWGCTDLKRKKATTAPESLQDDDIFLFHRVTEIVEGLHWVENIFQNSSDFNAILNDRHHRSRCGSHMTLKDLLADFVQF